MPLHRILLSTDGAEGSGAANGQETEGTPGGTKPPTVEERATKLAAKYEQDLTGLAKHLLGQIDELEKRNQKARERARQAEDKLALSEDRLASGSVILNPEQATLWTQYNDLGSLKELRKVIREHGEQGERLALIAREAEIDGLVEILPDLKTAGLKKLIGDRTIEVKDVKDSKTGKKSKAVYIGDGTGEAKEIHEYVDEVWPEFKPAIFGEGSRATASFGTPRRDLASQAPNGRVPQTGPEVTPESLTRDLRSMGVGAF